jgi:hypothetical protein
MGVILMGINIKEKESLKGRLYVIERDAKTNEIISQTTYTNIITNAFRDLLASAMAGGTVDLEISGLAVGDGDTAAAVTDTALTSQISTIKAPVAESLNDDTAETVSATFYFASTDSNWYGTWKEMGLYGNDDDTLFTHTVLDPTKTFDNTKSITIIYEIEL